MNTSVANGTILTGYCPSCGEDMNLSNDGRCPRGHLAMIVHTQKGIDENKFKISPIETTPQGWFPQADKAQTAKSELAVIPKTVTALEVADESSTKVIVLPASRAAREWIRQTQALIDNLVEAKKRFESNLKAERRHIARTEKAIAALTTSLDSYRVEESSTPIKTYTWSVHYEKCIDCGTKETKHKSNGRCITCDSTMRREANRLK